MTFARDDARQRDRRADGKIEAARDQHERLPDGDDREERGVAENIEDIDDAVEVRLDERHHDDDDQEQERQQPGAGQPLAEPGRQTLAGAGFDGRDAHRAAAAAGSSSLKKDASTLLSVFCLALQLGHDAALMHHIESIGQRKRLWEAPKRR